MCGGYRTTDSSTSTPPAEDVPPSLVVEVRSPGTWRFDVGRKRDVYQEVGVQELWLVDTPAATVIVFRRATANSLNFDVVAEVGRGDDLDLAAPERLRAVHRRAVRGLTVAG